MDTSIDALRADQTIAVIDGNSLMHRAFHAVPTTMNAPDGRPTNACFGFLSMLFKLVDEFEPNAIVCAFDAGVPAFRTDALREYKAQRPPTDPLLKEQFPMMERLLEALRIPVVRVQGWEGDDILGTLAAKNADSSRDMLLVTGDKDALQLVTEDVEVVTTKKGLSDVVIYDIDGVFDKWGIAPEQVPDFLALQGDSSDNIPGVPGIGPKTATRLLQQYGTLDEVIANADKVKGKMGERLRENVQSALDSRVVATISRDVPLDLDLDLVHFPSYSADDVRSAFGELRLNMHQNKALQLLAAAGEGGDGGDAGEVVWGSAGDEALFVVEPFDSDSRPAREALERALDAGAWVSAWFDSGEDAGQSEAQPRLFVGMDSGVVALSGEEARDALVALFERGRVVTLDSKKLLEYVYPPDSALKAELSSDAYDPTRVFDVSLASYLLDSQRSSYELGALLQDVLAQGLPDTEVPERRGRMSAAALLALREPLVARLDEDGSLGVYRDIDAPLVPVLAHMERTGVDLDVARLDELEKTTAASIERLRLEIHRLAGEDFNIDSPKQLGAVLFDKLGLPATKRTKTGYSTDASVLASLSDRHPLPGKVLEYRELTKMQSTYIEALPRLRGADGRLHTSFHQMVTATGRLSSSDPNLQNIPVRTDFGRQIREALSPQGDDEVFVAGDYSQIELRLLAHLSGDSGLVEAFCSGLDFHSQTAARIFGVQPESVTPQMRSRAKAVNFGIVYGQQAFGLGKSLHIPLAEAQEMIDRYFAAYPRVRDYLHELVEQARQTGYAVTMFGRKRHIPELAARNANLRAFGERTAMNHPMQGSAADIIKLAMVDVERRLAASGLHARFCLQVHDELDFECPRDEVEELSSLVRDAMQGVVELKVPLLADVSAGANWAQAK
ncbi:MAG: DNA polymerase I [Coriobacteriales bacterium]